MTLIREFSQRINYATYTRNWSILALHRQGMTFREIGKKFGVTKSRVQQIVAHQKRLLDYILGISEHDLDIIESRLEDLSTRFKSLAGPGKG